MAQSTEYFPLEARISNPSWLIQEEHFFLGSHLTNEEMVGLAIELSRRNVQEATGGPFGAVIAERKSRKVIACAVNSVLRLSCSLAHAEIMAIILAQTRFGLHDLHSVNGGMVLATSAQPCSQCCHAIWWSGINELVIGARTCDVEKLTCFHEGPVPSDIKAFFEERGGDKPPITVTQDVLRQEACAVLKLYTSMGGNNYCSSGNR